MKKLIYPLSCLVLVTALSACGMNRAAAPNPAKPNASKPARTQSAPTHTDGAANRNTAGFHSNAYGGGAAGNTSMGAGQQGTSQFDQLLADRLSRTAESVPGVQRAHAIVRGKEVVVGVQNRATTQGATQRRVVDRQVHSAVRQVAPNYKIHVTSDPAMVNRIKQMQSSIRGQATGGGAQGAGVPGTGGGVPGAGTAGGNLGGRGGTNYSLTGGPPTVAGNLGNVGQDFAILVRDLGRTVTAPFRR